MKIYDLVKQLLTDHPELRDSDNRLIWATSESFREAIKSGDENEIYWEFMKIKFESIRRCRQKIQEKHPELRGTEKIRKARAEIADQKGTHIFRETVTEQPELV